MERIRETAQDGVTRGQAKLDRHQAKHDADQMFKILGQAYYAQQTGRADPAQVEELAAGMRPRMAPIEALLGPVPFPEPTRPGFGGPDRSRTPPPTSPGFRWGHDSRPAP